MLVHALPVTRHHGRVSYMKFKTCVPVILHQHNSFGNILITPNRNCVPFPTHTAKPSSQRAILFWALNINSVISYIVFLSGCLLSLNTVFQRSSWNGMYASACSHGRIVLTVWIWCFIYLSVWGYLDCSSFWLLQIMLLWTFVSKSLYVFTSLG